METAPRLLKSLRYYFDMVILSYCSHSSNNSNTHFDIWRELSKQSADIFRLLLCWLWKLDAETNFVDCNATGLSSFSKYYFHIYSSVALKSQSERCHSLPSPRDEERWWWRCGKCQRRGGSRWSATLSPAELSFACPGPKIQSCFTPSSPFQPSLSFSTHLSMFFLSLSTMSEWL